MRKLASKTQGLQSAREITTIAKLVARRGVRWEVNRPPAGRRLGRKEKKKKGKTREGEKEGKEGRWKGELVCTLVPVGRRIFGTCDKQGCSTRDV